MNEKDKMEMLINLGYKYCPNTGNCYKADGYIIKGKEGEYVRFTIQINGITYRTRVHRFGYYCIHKTLPKSIDHINRDKSDNRIVNLRDGSKDINIRNTERVEKAKGYWWAKHTNRWVAAIKINYKSIHLGYFNTEEEAHNAYLQAKKKYLEQ
jgi:hypothetical protein